MSKELVKKNIDGSEYEFEQFGALLSLKTLTRLTKIVGEPLSLGIAAVVGKGEKKSLLEREMNPELLSKAVKALVEKLDQDEVISLITLLTSEKAVCDGKKIIFDSHYSGKLDHLFKVIHAALEVQYGNFIGGLLGNLGSKIPVAMTEESPK